MTNDEHREHLLDRLQHAGGFESYLINAWLRADEGNARRIEEAFPHDYRIPIGKPPVTSEEEEFDKATEQQWEDYEQSMGLI
jgi:hypothetical protein|tara:strand:+ start:55 stop:300 length:246 start_codon:yes stop_codon:yes gene_type:complete